MANTGNSNSFDRLVANLSSGEREDLLEKMRASSSVETESLVSENRIVREENISFADRIKAESVFYRVWLWIKSLFASTPVEVLYNEHLVSVTSKQIERDFPGLADYKRSMLLSAFYDKLNDLKLCADFFRPYIASEDKDEDAFLIFLGSLVMKDIYTKFSQTVDPYSVPVTNEPKAEQRMLLLKNMDELTATISDKKRTEMYNAFRSVEWLKQFTRLPFQRFITLFTSISDVEHTCPFGSVTVEIDMFAKILCNGLKIPDEVLEALFLFSRKDDSSISLDSAEADEEAASTFMSKAKSYISMMKMFITSVPLYLLGNAVHNDARWQPENFAGGEDWFVRFKAVWKKLFDRKWESWNNDCKKEGLRKRFEANFGVAEFPFLPNRPWVSARGGITFRYELTAGFLYWYFTAVFPKFEPVLKTIMLEGDFVLKENRQEFTDAFNNFVQVSIDLSNFDRRMSNGGEYGAVFAKFESERIRSPQTHSKIENIMENSEDEIKAIIFSFGDACRVFELCCSGIFNEKKDSKYDSLSNMKKISGKDPELFNKKLVDARNSLRNAHDLIKELEVVDTPSYFNK